MIRNILYAFKTIIKISPLYFIGQLIVMFMALLAPIADVIAPTLIIEKLMVGAPLRDLFLLIGIIVAIELFRGLVITFITSSVFPACQEKIKARLNEMLIQKLAGVDYVNLENAEYYDKLELSFLQADRGFLNVFDSAFFWLNALLYIGSLIFIVAQLDALLIIIAVVTAVLVLLSQVLSAKINYRYEKILVKQERKQNYFKGIFYKYLFFKDIKIFQSHDFFEKNYRSASAEKIGTVQKRSRLLTAVNMLSCALKLIFLLAGSMLYIVYRVHIGAVMIASFVALYNATRQCSNQLIELVNTSGQLYRDGLYINYFKNLYALEPKIEKEGGIVENNLQDIRVNDVSFSYPGSGEKVLQNISFHIKKGEKIAVVGVNGAGKSTLVKLLLRFYDPDAGTISANGHALPLWNIESLRQKVSYLPQEINFYNVSIAENVLMKACETEEEEAAVKELLAQVGLIERVNELPQGIYTILGKEYDETGTMLSGGELQKLAMARALRKPFDVLIMDEPSSALDPLSADRFLKNMLAVTKEKTAIIITHQLSLTKFADKILCFENGKITETGTHEELMRLNGTYCKMYEAQSIWYSEDENACSPRDARLNGAAFEM